MKTWVLQNPQPNFVRRARISEIGENRYCLTVETVYGDKMDCYRSLLGAKLSFAFHYQKGAVWKEETIEKIGSTRAVK